jgi:hypothetical protein
MEQVNMAGKGSKRRKENIKRINENWDLINWDKDNKSQKKDTIN